MYLEDCRIGELNNGGIQGGGYFAYARDSEHAVRLWQLSEEAFGLSFDLA